MDPQDPRNIKLHNKTAVTWVSEICDKLKTEPIYKIFDCPGAGSYNYEVKLTIRRPHLGFTTVVEFSRTKKNGKQAAAISMLNALGIRLEDIPLISKLRDVTLLFSKARSMMMTIRDYSAATMETIPEEEEKQEQGKRVKALAKVQDPDPEEVVKVKDNFFEEVVKVRKIVPGSDLPPEASGSEFVGNLTAYCLNRGLSRPFFDVTSVEGPAHAPVFSMNCTVSWVGQGVDHHFFVPITMPGTKRQVKQALAQKMMMELETYNFQLQRQPRLKIPKIVVEDYDQMCAAKASAPPPTKVSSPPPAKAGTSKPRRRASHAGDFDPTPVEIEPPVGFSGSVSAPPPPAPARIPRRASIATAYGHRSGQPQGCNSLARRSGSYVNCMCFNCIAEAKRVLRHISNAEAMIEKYFEAKRARGITAFMNCKVDVHGTGYKCFITVHVGAVNYCIHGEGPSVNAAKKKAFFRTLDFIEGGLKLLEHL